GSCLVPGDGVSSGHSPRGAGGGTAPKRTPKRSLPLRPPGRRWGNSFYVEPLVHRSSDRRSSAVQVSSRLSTPIHRPSDRWPPARGRHPGGTVGGDTPPRGGCGYGGLLPVPVTSQGSDLLQFKTASRSWRAMIGSSAMRFLASVGSSARWY